MRIEELQELADRAELHGLSRCILVINRGSCPQGFKIRVTGMGLGEIVNMIKRENRVDIAAWFHLTDVRRYIRLYKKQAGGEK
jgi:hypothetical protein